MWRRWKPPSRGADRQSFTAAVEESLEYADAHPDEVRDIVQTYTEIDDELISQVTLPTWSSTINEESTQKLADLAEQDGLLEKPADLSALLP